MAMVAVRVALALCFDILGGVQAPPGSSCVALGNKLGLSETVEE